MTTKAAPKGTRSIQRTLGVLQVFRAGEVELALAEIAERADLPKPTAHRILAALASLRMVEHREGGHYRLGPGAAELGFRAMAATVASPPRPTPFSATTFASSSSQLTRTWNGSIGAESYDPTFEREAFAVRGGAGVLDVSPLFLYEFKGPQAEDAVQRIVTRDVRRCRTDQVMYTAWCDDDGHLLQDGNLIRLGRNRFRLSAAEASLRWFQDCADGLDVEVTDVGDRVAKLAVQGPLSRSLLHTVLDDDPDGADRLEDLDYFRGTQARFEGQPIYVTRTGFTGDLGYELWLDLDAASAREAGAATEHDSNEPARRLWRTLLTTDWGPAVIPMGLAALDATRIEAGLILIDVDYFSASHASTEERRSTPDEAGLGWACKLVAGNDFIGRRRIEEERQRGVQWRFIGVEVPWSELEAAYLPHGLRPQIVGRPPSRQSLPLHHLGDDSREHIGQVTSSYFSPRLKKMIGLASVHRRHGAKGNRLELELPVERERVPVTAEVVSLPFYEPPHKKAKGASLGRRRLTIGRSSGSKETSGSDSR